jgi:hypothetical protein
MTDSREPQRKLPGDYSSPEGPIGPAPATPPTPSPTATAGATPSPGQSASSAQLSSGQFEDEGARMSIGRRIRHMSPAFVTIVVGSLGSAGFLLVAMTSHTTPVGVLLSAGVVATLVFLMDTLICTVATYRAARDARSFRALVMAVLGGISAVIFALSLAGTVILTLLLRG